MDKTTTIELTIRNRAMVDELKTEGTTLKYWFNKYVGEKLQADIFIKTMKREPVGEAK